MKLSLAKKTHNGKQYIVPSDDYAQNELEKLKDGDYMITISQQRNRHFHNKAMKFIRTLFENQDEYTDFDNFFALIKLQLGYFDLAKSIQKKVEVPIIRSISFEAMDELQFNDFYRKLSDFAMQKYGIDKGAVQLIEAFC